MSKSRSARTLLRAAATRVARSLVRQANGELVRSMIAEHLEQRQMLARVNGLDVTHFQGTINWTNVRAAGYEFAYEKATEGVGVLDSALATNMSGGAAAGLLMGAFHYAQPDTSANDAVNEANYFVAQAGKYMKGGWLRPAVQIDTGSTLGKTALSTWVNTFVSTVQSATSVTPLVYATTDYATNYLNSTVANKNLWIANYNYSSAQAQGSSSPPTGSWGSSGSSWTTWRYNASGTVNGVTGNTTDLDVFNGDRTALQSLVIAPPANPFQLNIDFGPATPAAPAGYVGVGSQAYGSLGGYTMGWTTSGVTTYARTGGTAPDDRYRTYAMPALGGVSRSFEVAVPNGSYTVRVVTGSPDQTGNAQKIVVEGTTAVNASTTSSTPFISGTVTVNVTDGKLTLSGDYNGWANTRLDFVDIVAGGRAAAPPVAPSVVTASRPTGTSVALTWQDNADNEGSFPASFNSATWGEVNRGYEIKRRTSTNGVWSGWTSIGYALSNATSYTDSAAGDSSATYQYRVVAMNSTGKSSEVESNSLPPRVMPTISGPSSVNEGATYTLTLATSGGSSPVTKWSVNWGDGSTTQVSGTAVTATHEFARGPHAYTIAATASDSTATYAAASTVAVQVADFAPVLTALVGKSASVGAKFQVPLASFVDAGFGLGETFTASVDWGDGSASTAGLYRIVTAGYAGMPTSGTVSGEHTYAAAGSYSISVTLTDAGGQSATVSVPFVSQPLPAPYQVPGAPGTETTVTFTVSNRNHRAQYHNELGLFFVDGPDYHFGSVSIPPSGSPLAAYAAYTQAALTDASRQVVIPRDASSDYTFTRSFVLPAGKYVAFYLVQDATTQDYLDADGTFSADYSTRGHGQFDPLRPNVFFLNPKANYDAFQHVRVEQADGQVPAYGFEDLTGGGDQDFDDLVFTVTAQGASDLTATANESAHGIYLNWSASLGERGYRIFRGLSEGALSPFIDVADGTTDFLDTKVVPGTTYYYSVAPLAANAQPGGRSAVAYATLLPSAVSTGSITGSVWNDADGDTHRTTGEPALNGIRVYVDANGNGSYDSAEVSTLTDVYGNYELLNLPVGTLPVRAVGPVGWFETLPANGVHSVSVSSGGTNSGNDFAFRESVESADPPNLSVHPSAAEGAIVLNWTESYSDDDGFTVERSTDNVSYSQIADLPGKDQANYVDSDVQVGTRYWYRVRAYHHGDSGHRDYHDYSNVDDAMLSLPDGQAAPVLTARGTIEGVNLDWTDNAINESAWIIERRTGGAAFAQVAALDGNTSYWTDHDVTPGTRYYYRVHARVGATYNPWSNEASALPLTGGGTWYYNSFEYNPKDWVEWSSRPQYTTDYTKRRLLGPFHNEDQTSLTWTLPKHDGVTLDFDMYVSGTWDGAQRNGSETWLVDADGRQLMRGGFEIAEDDEPTKGWGSSNLGQPLELNIDGDHFTKYHFSVTFPHVDPKITVNFRLLQTDDEMGTYDEKWYLDNVRLSDGNGAGSIPDAPTQVQAGYVSSANSGYAQVSWKPSIDPSVAKYYIYESLFPDFPADGSTFPIQSTEANHTSKRIQLPDNAHTVYFKVVATTKDNQKRSLPSAETSLTVNGPVVVPLAPTNLRLASAGATDRSATITWDDNSDNEGAFTVERSSDGVAWAADEYSFDSQEVEANVNVFEDAYGNTGSGAFFYRVLAHNDAGSSAYSNVFAVHAPPRPPADLRATQSANSDVSLTWSTNGSSVDHYLVERSALPNFSTIDFSQSVQVNTASTVQGYIDEGLAPGVSYYYRVVAYNAYTDAGGSRPTYARALVTGDVTAPLTPAYPFRVKQSTDGITLEWDANVESDLIGYRVYRQIDGDDWEPMQAIDEVIPKETPWWADPELKIGQTAGYRVTAVDRSYNESTPTRTYFAGRSEDSITPATPANVDAKSYPQAIQLTWDQNTESDFAGWYVYYKMPSALDPKLMKWVKLNDGKMITDTLGFNDYDAPIGKTRSYMVTAVNLYGRESAGAVVDQFRSRGAEPPAPDERPQHGRGVKSHSRRLGCGDACTKPGDSGDALAGYNVYRKNGAHGSSWTQLNPVSSTAFCQTRYRLAITTTSASQR